MKSSINREFDYVRLKNRSIIERSTVFDWKMYQSRVRLCSIKEAFDYRTFDCVRLAKFLGEFDCVRLPNSIKINRTIEFDWVRLPNVRLTTPGIWGFGFHPQHVMVSHP